MTKSQQGFLFFMPLMVNTKQSLSWHLTAKMCGLHTTSNMKVCPWVYLCLSESDGLKCRFLWFNNSNYHFGGDRRFIGLWIAWTELSVFVLLLSLCHTQTYLGVDGCGRLGVWWVNLCARIRCKDVLLSSLSMPSALLIWLIPFKVFLFSLKERKRWVEAEKMGIKMLEERQKD